MIETLNEDLQKEGRQGGSWRGERKEGKKEVSATNWHLTATSARNTSSAAAAADLNTLRTEFRVESRTEAVCTPGKTGRTGLQRVRYSQERFHEPSYYICSHPEKLTNGESAPRG